MERFELDESLQNEIRDCVFGDGFMKIVQSVRRNGKNFKISMRPVDLGGRRMFQAEMTDAGQVRVKNFDTEGAREGLEEIIAQRGARDLHLMSAGGDLHIRVTKKGRVMVSRSAEMNREVVIKPHDRVKKLPLTSFDSSALLRALSLADAEGRLRASMRGKYDQVNEFLKVVAETLGDVPQKDKEKTFTIVDCGCGKAYLTVSLYPFLTEVLGFADVRIVGVDRRADVIREAKNISSRLDIADRVVFVQSDLSVFNPSEAFPAPEKGECGVDLVVSLHACDTATDEALAKGVEWKAKYILSAPCCQHELQKVLDDKGAFAALMRQSILRERLCDILTDSFRAQIMRIMGFRTQVIEFVSSEATARNILLKCVWGVKPAQSGPVSEYLELRDYWHVTPWLESRLGRSLADKLSRYE